MGDKSSLKLPGVGKDKKREVESLPMPLNKEPYTEIQPKILRMLLGKGVYPVYLDFSTREFQLEDVLFLRNCPNIVKELNLSNNSIVECNLSPLSKMKRLVIDNNLLVSILFTGLSSLSLLSAANNRLEQLDDMSELKKLIYLDLSYNRIVTGWDELAKLKNTIKVIDLAHNGIDLPLQNFHHDVVEGSLKKLARLEYLGIGGNPICTRVQEFKYYVIHELPRLRYYNWELITKEDRVRAARLEADGLWSERSLPLVNMGTMTRTQSSALLVTQPPTAAGGVATSGASPSLLLHSSSSSSSSSSMSNNNLSRSNSTSTNPPNSGNILTNSNNNILSHSSPSLNMSSSSSSLSTPSSSPMGAPRSSHDDLKSVDLMMSSGQQADAKALILQRMLEEFDQAGFRATPPPSVSRSQLPAVAIEAAAPAPSEAIETLDLLMNEFLDDNANNAVNVNTDSYSNDLSFTSSSASHRNGYDPMDATQTQTTPEPPPAPVLASVGALGPLPDLPPPDLPPPPSHATASSLDDDMMQLQQHQQQPAESQQDFIDLLDDLLKGSGLLPDTPVVQPNDDRDVAALKIIDSLLLDKSTTVAAAVDIPATPPIVTSSSAAAIGPTPDDLRLADRLDAIISEVATPNTLKSVNADINSALKTLNDDFSTDDSDEPVLTPSFISDSFTSTTTTTITSSSSSSSSASSDDSTNISASRSPKVSYEDTLLDELLDSFAANSPYPSPVVSPLPSRALPATSGLSKLTPPPPTLAARGEPASTPTTAPATTQPIAPVAPATPTTPATATPTATPPTASPSLAAVAGGATPPAFPQTPPLSAVSALIAGETKARRASSSLAAPLRAPAPRLAVQAMELAPGAFPTAVATTISEAPSPSAQSPITSPLITSQQTRQQQQQPVTQPATQPAPPQQQPATPPVTRQHAASVPLPMQPPHPTTPYHPPSPAATTPAPSTPTSSYNNVIPSLPSSTSTSSTINRHAPPVSALPAILPPSSSSAAPLAEIAKPKTEVPWQELTMKDKLGVGSFGDVYMGEWNGHVITIKKLRQQRFSDVFLNALRREAEPIFSLSHVGLVPLSGLCLEENICLLHPYTEGLSLNEIIESSSSPSDNNQQSSSATHKQINLTNHYSLIKIALQIAQAMQYLHSHNIPHRALKPKNIIVDNMGVVHLRDYSFKTLKDQVFKTGQVSAYLAPEIFSSQADSYTVNVDQFAFAMVLFEMFTLQPPFPPLLPPKKLAEAIIAGTRPTLPPTVPSALDRLIRACWSPAPEQRPSFEVIVRILSQPPERLLGTLSSGSAASSPVTSPAPVRPNAPAQQQQQQPPPPSVSPPPPSSISSKPASSTTNPAATKPLFQPVSPPASTTASSNRTNTTTAPAKTPSSSSATGGEMEAPLSPELASVLRPRWQTVDEGARKKMNLVLSKITDMLDTKDKADVPLKACKALENLASQPNNTHLIALSGIAKHLVPLLERDDPPLQEQALRVTCLLAEDLPFGEDFCENNGLVPLTQLVSSRHDNVALAACRVLTCLSVMPSLLGSLRDARAHLVLIPLLRSRQDFLQFQCTWALSRLLSDDRMCSEFIASSGVQPLITLMATASSSAASSTASSMALSLQQQQQGGGVQATASAIAATTSTNIYVRALLALSCLASDAACRALLARAGVVAKLIALLETDNNTLRYDVIRAIDRLGRFSDMSDLVCHDKGVDKLYNIMVAHEDLASAVLLTLRNLTRNVPCYQAFTQLGGPKFVFDQLSSTPRLDLVYALLTFLSSYCKHAEGAASARAVGCTRLIVDFLLYGLSPPGGRSFPPSDSISEVDLKVAAANALSSTEADAQLWTELAADPSRLQLIILNALSLIRDSTDTSSSSSGPRQAGLRLVAVIASSGQGHKLPRLCEAVRECPGLIMDLVACVSSTQPQETKNLAAIALSWLSGNPNCRRDIFDNRGLDPLVSLLLQPISDISERVLWSISNFAVDSNYQKSVVDSGAIFPVARFISPPVDSATYGSILSNTMKIILILSQNPGYHEALRDAGVIQGLQQCLTNSNKTIAVASQRALSMMGV